MNCVLIDTRGLSCPLPVLKLRKTMRNIAAPAQVTILATDPGAEEDIRVYCATSGCRFIAVEKEEGDGVLKIVIQK